MYNEKEIFVTSEEKEAYDLAFQMTREGIEAFADPRNDRCGGRFYVVVITETKNGDTARAIRRRIFGS